MRDLLKRGIAVHHSGILPILKEVKLALHNAYVLRFGMIFLSHISMRSDLLRYHWRRVITVAMVMLCCFLGYRTVISERLSESKYTRRVVPHISLFTLSAVVCYRDICYGSQHASQDSDI